MKAIKTLKALVIVSVGGAVISLSSMVVGQNGPPVRMPIAPSEDVKSFGGAMCHPMDSVDAGNVVYGVGIWNDSMVDNVEIVCPVVRDDVMGIDGTAWVTVSVYRSSITTFGFECTFFSTDSAGYPTAAATDSTTSTGDHILYLDVDESAAYGYYTLACILPPNSTLWSYRIYEHQDGYDDMTDYNN